MALVALNPKESLDSIIERTKHLYRKESVEELQERLQGLMNECREKGLLREGK
jgi:hypothetical protein